ncbi:hypothetical protein [Pontiella sp.]|uniref:hypothetical protein n=1 Tax=Pontiella sp. TaxID=2837462 RepID=UPI003567644B
MILKPGEKIHLMVRRNFDGDLRRHFVGEIIEATEMLARVEGYVYVLDTATNQYLRRADKRIRIVALTDANNIINVLPANANLDEVKYAVSADSRRIFTDGKTFCMDVNEFGLNQ